MSEQIRETPPVGGSRTETRIDDDVHSSATDRREMIAAGGGNVVAATTTERHNWSRINDSPMWYFFALFATVLVAVLTDSLPPGLLSGLAVTVMLGGLLIWIGSLIPGLRNFGLPTILCTFVPAALIFFGIMPENVTTVVTDFMDTIGFLDFIIAAIIAGAVLGMPRQLLVRAGPRFAVPLVGCVVLTFLVIGGLGAALGRGFVDSILLIAAPVMAGGLGVGALPMSEMYASQTGDTAAMYLSGLMAAVVLANIVCILAAGVLNGLGRSRVKMFVGFDGKGELLRVKSRAQDLKMPPKKTSATFLGLGKGVMITAVLYTLGTTLNTFFPVLHEFAWLIVAAALLKVFRLFPDELEESASEWGDLMTTYFVPALLVGVSIAYIDLEEVIQAVGDPVFMLLVITSVLVAGLIAGLLGMLVRFYFLEAAVTPGLVMADTGGSGDVAVLSAAGRIHLMPFAALTTRLGGALTLFITSLLVPFLG